MTTTTLPDLPRRTATEHVQRYWLDRRTTVDGEGDRNLWCRGGTVIDPVGRGSEPRQQRDPHGTDQEAALLQQQIGDGSRLVAPPHCRPHIEACAT